MVSSTSVFHFWNLNIFVLFLGWSSGNSEYFLSSINPFYPALFLFEQSNCNDWIILLLYTLSEQDMVFLVYDFFWTTIRNEKSISADSTEDTIKNQLELSLFLLLLDNLVVVVGFLHCRINTIYVYCLTIQSS